MIVLGNIKNSKPSPIVEQIQESPFSTVARTTKPKILPTSNETLPYTLGWGGSQDALDTTEQNWQRILAERQNVILAVLNYDAELKQFREGLRTMTESFRNIDPFG